MSSTIRGNGRRRRTGDRAPRAQVEEAVVTRAVQMTPCSGRGITAQDRCVHFWLYATNSDAVEPHQHAGIVLAGVAKHERAADGDVVDRRDARRLGGLSAAPPPPVLHGNPELAHGERAAGEHQELHEIAALDVVVLRPVDREVLPPGGLLLGRTEVRRDRDLLAVAARVARPPDPVARGRS